MADRLADVDGPPDVLGDPVVEFLSDEAPAVPAAIRLTAAPSIPARFSSVAVCFEIPPPEFDLVEEGPSVD